MAQEGAQRASSHQFHHQVEQASLFTKVIDFHNIGMSEGGSRLGFLQKAGAKFGIACEMSVHHFDGGWPIEMEVDATKDLPHTAEEVEVAMKGK